MAGRTRHNVSEKEKPQTRRMQDVLRLAGELSIVQVLNDFQPLLILRISRAREIELYPSVTP
ncbi:hypothetical protein GC267_26510 [Escherichia coli]|nr:hypothetical protein [Escherichia coli]EEW2448073.1 hypothetical protein [Escherichia coli]EFE7851865.1 hypothetical protein [Escherichia coli]MBF8815771.1 hypothetical protein [Escherichia coli]MBF8898262.1 hypothetical protein [Escherichia coli]